MMNMNSWIFVLTMGLNLIAQMPLAPPERVNPSQITSDVAPTSTLSLGAYSQSVSDRYGIWQGMLIDATWNPWKDGKFLASLLTTDRREGRGTVFSVGKYQTFHGGYAFIGAATSQGADYLPTIQGIVDINLDISLPGLVLGGGCVYTKVRDGHENTQVSLGPTLYVGNFIHTLRWMKHRSNPGGYDSNATIFQIRHGAQDHHPWQILRIAWGGEAYRNLLVQEAVTARGVGMGLDAFFPLGKHWTFQAGVEWAQKNNVYRLWGGSVRLGRWFH